MKFLLYIIAFIQITPNVQSITTQLPRLGPSKIAHTSHGPVQGYRTAISEVYKKIPFAMAPIGLLRWNPPQSPPSWHPRVYDATEDSFGCPQIHCTDLTPPIACPTETSEDCLQLDIFTPLGLKNTSKLAVMVFIHGGNFFYMSGTSPLFDGSVLAERGNVVVVNINYRLGALGFLVTGKSDDDAVGNYGLMDQILAMQWVQKNIQNFGGDPNQVTIFGQSAGGQSILQLLTNPEASKLFHRVIVESAPSTLPYKNFEEAYLLGGLFAEQLNCTVGDLKCMRTKTADEVVKAAFASRKQVASLKLLEMFEPYGPYVDGKYVLGQPMDIYKSGRFSPKPMIVGHTSEECVMYIYGTWKSKVDLETYLAVLTATKPSKVPEIIETYPPEVLKFDQREVLVNISTDLVFGCSTRNVTRSYLQKVADVYFYVWDHAFSFPGWGPISFCEGRVCHGSELVYLFHTEYKGNFTFTDDEKKLSDDLISYWANFAWTGDPNKKGPQPTKSSIFRNELGKVNNFNIPTTRASTPITWPKYSPGSSWKVLWFETPSRKIVDNYKSKYCNFWDHIGY